MKHILTFAALVFATSCFGQEACPNMYDGNGNGTIDIEDFLGILGLFGDVDSDADGLWDSQDGCVDVEACNYSSPLAGICTYQDALGDCNGNCPADADGDGVCDVYLCGDLVSYHGYEYATVLIGDQCWFAENLRSESYENGDAIPTGSSLADWDEASGQAYQVAYGGLPAAICEDFSTTIDACDPAQSLDTYGLLYNNFAVTDSRGICPQGWHVGTDEDWGEIEVFLGMDEATVFTEGFRGTNQGTMIKTTTGWQNNGSGTDEVGFHGHPSGGIAPDQDRFGNGGSDAVWWTPSETNGLDRRRSMNDYNDGIRRGTLSPTSGAAIRCLQD